MNILIKTVSFIGISTVCLAGCSSNDSMDAREKEVVVQREYINEKPVRKDVTTQSKYKRQAGAALAAEEYELVLAKRSYGYLKTDSRIEDVTKSSIPIKPPFGEDQNKVENKEKYDSSRSNKVKDESIYKKDESVYKK